MFVHYAKPNNHFLANHKSGELKQLMPGWNEFPNDLWDMNKDSPEIKKMIEEGHIKLSDVKITEGVGKKKVVTELSKAEGEVKLTAIADEKKCLEIISETYNRDLLQRWSDEETRSKVKRAIVKQLEKVTPKAKKED